MPCAVAVKLSSPTGTSKSPSRRVSERSRLLPIGLAPLDTSFCPPKTQPALRKEKNSNTRAIRFKSLGLPMWLPI